MIAPKDISEMKEQIKNTFYYSIKLYNFTNKKNANKGSEILCDICRINQNKEDLLLCICCEINFCHYYCDNNICFSVDGYICPKCREIFNLDLNN